MQVPNEHMLAPVVISLKDCFCCACVQVSGGVDADSPGEGAADAAADRAHRYRGPEAAAVQLWLSSSGQ